MMGSILAMPWCRVWRGRPVRKAGPMLTVAVLRLDATAEDGGLGLAGVPTQCLTAPFLLESTCTSPQNHLAMTAHTLLCFNHCCYQYKVRLAQLICCRQPFAFHCHHRGMHECGVGGNSPPTPARLLQLSHRRMGGHRLGYHVSLTYLLPFITPTTPAMHLFMNASSPPRA